MANDLEKLKKRLFLNYLLSQIFAPDVDLAKELEKVEQKKQEADPFFVPGKLPEQSMEYKAPKYMQKFDGERFKALKNKALKQEVKDEEINNAETGRTE